MITPVHDGWPANQWIPLFARADVETEKLAAAKTARSKATTIGNFLSRHVGRQVSVRIWDQNGTATLRVKNVRSGQKRYWFDVRLEDEPDPNASAMAPGPDDEIDHEAEANSQPARGEDLTETTEHTDHRNQIPTGENQNDRNNEPW